MSKNWKVELKKYFDEACGLGIFMISAGFFDAIIQYIFITFESPFSGRSMNSARTFASAIVAGEWKSFWVYCTTPVLGMLAGEHFYRKYKIYFLK